MWSASPPPLPPKPGTLLYNVLSYTKKLGVRVSLHIRYTYSATVFNSDLDFAQPGVVLSCSGAQ